MNPNRLTLRQAADLTGKSVDTLRRYYRQGQLPGAGPLPGDPTKAIWIPVQALVDLGLLAPDALVAGETEAVLARKAAERERDSSRDELVTLRTEKAALQRELARLVEQHEQLQRHLTLALKARAA